MNNLLLFMAIGGSIPLILYLGLRYLFHFHYRCPQQMYLLLKISLFFYLVPVPLLGNRLRGIFRAIAEFFALPDAAIQMTDTIRLDTPKFYEITPDGNILLHSPGVLFIVGLCLWLLIAVILLCRMVSRYFHTRKTILANASAPSPSIAKKMGQICSQISLSRNIHIAVIEGEFPAITLGIISPIIVIPKDIDMNAVHLLFLHECLHIKKRDALVKILSVLTVILHWYLPFVYLLVHEINYMAELDCDDRVSRYLNEAELKDYGNLIITLSSESFSKPLKHNLFVSSLRSQSYHMTKERLTMLKRKNRKKLIPLTFGILLAVCFGTVSAAGYQPPMSHVVAQFEDANRIDFYTDSSISDSSFLSEDSADGNYSLDIEYFKLTDSYFLSDDGDVFIPDETNVTRLFCNHTYISGQERVHIPNTSGGCTVKFYNAKRCTKCGQVVQGDLISTHIFVTCPHA